MNAVRLPVPVASRRSRWRRAAAIRCATAVIAALLQAQGVALGAATYAEVAALFANRCIVCHSGPAAPNGLRLDSYASILAGGKNGAVVIAGSAQSSELVKRIRGERQPRMPLTGPPYLSDSEIGLVEAWIQAGAPKGIESPAAEKPERAAPPPATQVTYAHIETILLSRCVKCHVERGGQMGPPPQGYVLRTYDRALASGERARVVPGNPGASELLRRVQGVARPRMPFDGPPWLADAEIALIGRWIADGARDREGKPAPIPVGAAIRLRGTLSAHREIDGAPFRLDGVRMDRGLRVGSSVELRGIVEPDGAIRAIRVRLR